MWPLKVLEIGSLVGAPRDSPGSQLAIQKAKSFTEARTAMLRHAWEEKKIKKILHHFRSSLQTPDGPAKQGNPLVVSRIHPHQDQAERRGKQVYKAGLSHFHVLRQHYRLGVAG